MKSNRPRNLRDFYETPYGLAKAALEHLSIDCVFSLKYTVDAGCGNGIWGKAFQEVFGDDYLIDGVDIEHPKEALPYSCFHLTDYTEWQPEIPPTLIIGNPPYNQMEQFVRHSWDIGDIGTYILFLCRLEFLASRRRQIGLYREMPPFYVTVLTRRPSFFQTKENLMTTDAMDYALFLWVVGSTDFHPTINWLYWEYT